MAGRRRGGYKAYAVKYLQGSSWYTAGGKGTKMPSEMADIVVKVLRKKGKTVKKVFDRPVNKFRSFRKKPKYIQDAWEDFKRKQSGQFEGRMLKNPQPRGVRVVHDPRHTDRGWV